MRHYSGPAAVNIVAGKPVGRVEVGDAFARFALLPLQPLGFAFAAAEFEQKPLTSADTDVSRWAAIMRARR